MTRRDRLADPEVRVPMPDRGGRLFRPGEKGEAVDPESRFYATLIAEGGIVEVSPDASRDAPEATPPVAPAGRATTGGGRSASRASPERTPEAKRKRT